MKRYRLFTFLLSVSLLLGVIQPAPAQQEHPALQYLGTLNGLRTVAVDINASGQVIGSNVGSAGLVTRAFIWSAATGMKDLGTLGGDSTGAFGINDLGQVVGGTTNAQGEIISFLWSEETGMVDVNNLMNIKNLDLEYVSVSVDDINNAGQLVGSFILKTNLYGQGFIWSPTTGLKEIGSLSKVGLNTAVFSLRANDIGQIIGISEYEHVSNDIPYMSLGVFLWTAEKGMQDIGYFGLKNQTIPRAINNLGQLVGFYTKDQNEWSIFRPFIWSQEGGMQDIGAQSGTTGVATGINDLGQVVGGDGHGAFFWSKETGWVDLSRLAKADLQSADAINNSGQVVGQTKDGNAYILDTKQLNIPKLLAGDANMDETVNVQDAVLVLQAAVGLVSLKPEQHVRADINGDLSINVKDATLILRKALKLS